MEFERIQKIIAEVLNLELDEITPESTFRDDLGADSLDVFQIIIGIEGEFDIESEEDSLENSSLDDIETVGDVVELVKNAMS